VRKNVIMLGPSAHSERLEADLDEVLATIALVGGDTDLQARSFARLVDVLVRAAFADVRERFGRGSLDRSAYVLEVSQLAQQCHRAGLLQLPLSDG
jgi:hypothetical protein